MGTSSPNPGPDGDTPLVPTWLGSGNPPQLPGAPPPSHLPRAPATPSKPGAPPPAPPDREPPQPPRTQARFRGARASLNRFAASGGSDSASLGRAVADYVATASGGARRASQRMGSSRAGGAAVLGFLVDARARGAGEALKTLRLEHLAGRPVSEIFLGVMEYACPGNGSIDEGIARDAFIETIAELADLGVSELDTLTVEQVQTVFELYATHAIEARICNDIGMQVITIPRSSRAASRVQDQIRDFIRRAVSDALTTARAALERLTPSRVNAFVNRTYENAFAILCSLGEAESEGE